jgi:hypothetical protein
MRRFERGGMLSLDLLGMFRGRASVRVDVVEIVLFFSFPVGVRHVVMVSSCRNLQELSRKQDVLNK